MVPGVAFGNFVSGATAGVAAHGGRPRSYGYDVKRCGILEHLHSPGLSVSGTLALTRG